MNMLVEATIPQVWYHSTELDPRVVAGDFANNNIDPMGTVKTEQYWFSDSWEASRYYGHNTVRARLDMKNPMVVTPEMRETHKGGPTHWAAFAQSMGHDGVVIEDIMDGDMFSTVCAVFSAAQIDAVPYSEWNEDTDTFDMLVDSD